MSVPISVMVVWESSTGDSGDVRRGTAGDPHPVNHERVVSTSQARVELGMLVVPPFRSPASTQSTSLWPVAEATSRGILDDRRRSSLRLDITSNRSGRPLIELHLCSGRYYRRFVFDHLIVALGYAQSKYQRLGF